MQTARNQRARRFRREGLVRDSGLGESGLAEAGDGVGGLGPELRFSRGSAGLTAYEPQRASGDSPDGEHHLPFHASTLAAEIRYGVGL